MLLLLGFQILGSVGKVCKLRKTLYGLKQSSRAWFERFSGSLKKIGYIQSQTDHTLFVKHRMKGTTTVIVYEDDIVITGDDPREVTRLKSYFTSEFEVKDLGALRYFLGIEVARLRKGIFISQRKYILDLLTKTGLLGTRPAETPIEVNHDLYDQDGRSLIDANEYQRLVRKLTYLLLIRPNIIFTVGVLSQFIHAL